MIIDIHTHLGCYEIFPERFISEVSASFGTDPGVNNAFIAKLIRGSLKDRDGTLFVQKMNDAGIHRSVLLIADFGIALGEASLSLDEIYLLHKQALDKHPDRFVVFGGVDPRRGTKGVDLFEKSIKQFGFSGLKLYPPCGFELDDPGLFPLYEICNQLELPVLTHTGPSLSVMRTEQRYPQTVLKIARQFKRIKFILAHAGARDCDTTIEVAKKRKNVYFDISTFQAFCTEKEELNRRFRRFFDHAPDQVIFGTDWPMFLLSVTQKQIVSMIDQLHSINALEKEKLFFGNANIVLPSFSSSYL